MEKSEWGVTYPGTREQVMMGSQNYSHESWVDSVAEIFRLRRGQ